MQILFKKSHKNCIFGNWKIINSLVLSMNIKALKYIILSVLLWVNFNLYSVELNFKYYKVEDGLTSNTIYTAQQDSKGFMWFGTENGINRFDGYSFISYENVPGDENSLINNSVHSITEDKNQNLWIGTEAGVSILDLNDHSIRRFTEQTTDGHKVNDKVENIIYYNNRTWMSSSRQGIFLYDDNRLTLFSFKEFQEKSNTPIWVTNMYMDKDGILWVSINNTDHQIYVYDEQTAGFTPAFTKLDTELSKRLSSYSIIETKNGTLWFGTWRNGLIKADKNRRNIVGEYLNTPNTDKITHIHTITEFNDSTLLIGSNDGLTSFRTSNNTLVQHIKEPVLSNRFVYPIYKDTEGGVWIGTYHGGINYSSANRNYFASYVNNKYENSLSGNVVSSFCEDDNNNIWIATEDGGLNKFNRDTERFASYNSSSKHPNLSHDNIHALAIDGNHLWIGTYSGGINKLNIDNGSVDYYYSDKADAKTLDDNSIYSIFLDSKSNLWVGSIRGINLYDREEDKFTRMKDIGGLIVDICEWNNNIWFATSNSGLYKYNPEHNEWTKYSYDKNDENSLINNAVISLSPHDKDYLWVGTAYGLCRYDYVNDIFIDEEVAFPSNYICNIFDVNDELWITTLRGLIHYRPSTKDYRAFNKSDGLLSDLFNANSGLKTRDGKIFMGTPYGFNSFCPKGISINRKEPSIEIIDFKLFNKSKTMNQYLVKQKNNSKALKLRHNQNSVSFEFTALSYFAPTKNEYAFMLEGFDKTWNDGSKERKATYTNIPPGKYTFKVKASNNDGTWNESGYELPITITPPIWWNRWSITFYLIILLATLFLILRQQKAKVLKRNEEKIRDLKEKQEKEIYKSRIEFFTNVAHEIRTPISLISAPLESILNSSESLSDEMMMNLNVMQSNSNRLLTLVNQILDFSKIENQSIRVSLANKNVHHVLNEVYRRFKPSAENTAINLEYKYDDKDFEAIVDSENITKVASNLLNNALKHTKDLVLLELDSSFTDSSFKITVSDNGAGVDEKEIEEIFKPFYQVPGQNKTGTGIGLYLVKSIAEALNGKIEIKTKLNEGFAVSVILPKEKETQAKSHTEGVQYEVNTEYISPVTKGKMQIEGCLENQDESRKSMLIVEDNPELQFFIQNQYKDTFDIFSANDGKEGLEVLEENEVDIIITDVMMPNMDGIEFCKAVKSNTEWNHIPVIMLTAKTDVESKIEAFGLGADAYLEKPFNLSYLTTRIKNLLDSREALFNKYSQTPFASLETVAENKDDELFLAKFNEIIEENINNSELVIDDIAKGIGVSSSSLYLKIKQITGVTPNKLVTSMRLKKAAELLSENTYRVSEVCYKVGFNNPSYFSKCFQRQFGVLPKDFFSKMVKPE